MATTDITSQSRRAVEAERALETLTGRRKTIDIVALEGLGVVTSPIDRDTGFGRPCRSFSATGERVRLPSDVLVMSFQKAVKADTVRVKVRELLRGVVLPDVMVTDRPASLGAPTDGSWWLLDGHHTLVAARLVGADVYGRVWR